MRHRDTANSKLLAKKQAGRHTMGSYLLVMQPHLSLSFVIGITLLVLIAPPT